MLTILSSEVDVKRLSSVLGTISKLDDRDGSIDVLMSVKLIIREVV